MFLCRWRENTRIGSPADFAGWAAKQRPSDAGVEPLVWLRDKARRRKGKKEDVAALATSVTQTVWDPF